MGDKKSQMGNVTGNSFGDNTNLQSDNNIQINIEESSEIKRALADLKAEIESIQTKADKEDAEMYYEMLQNYIEVNNQSRIENCLKKLKGLVGTAASLLTIASYFGVVL